MKIDQLDSQILLHLIYLLCNGLDLRIILLHQNYRSISISFSSKRDWTATAKSSPGGKKNNYLKES